ncbi:response regulator [Oscillatoria sp. FACHB-1407]|uniref:response regulator n=1 Tax=Oscillatoria sp. FACHB-1407 TaxID=2692847 RepID=UPI0016862625|nr:response regulator [Oscillatoria sp. FACHB-1407]MBD2464772.1 response regulator [Oscillatoria sp. FACHB-1407]
MTTRKILFINGNPNVREAMQEYLSCLGEWEVIEAISPSQGLQRAVQDQPDAIVLDLAMFGVDYFTFLKSLRAQPTTQTIPVVILTTGAKWLDIKRLQAFKVMGAIDYSSNLDELVEKIKKLLDWSEKSALTDEF